MKSPQNSYRSTIAVNKILVRYKNKKSPGIISKYSYNAPEYTGLGNADFLGCINQSCIEEIKAKAYNRKTFNSGTGAVELGNSVSLK